MGSSVFTYGTLQIPEVMEAVTGRRFEWTEARLAGFACATLVERIYPGIVSRAGASTQGRLWAAVDDASLRLLVDFEDDFYERRTVNVTVGAETHAAEAWVIPHARRHLLGTEEWDLERFVRDHLSHYLEACARPDAPAPRRSDPPRRSRP